MHSECFHRFSGAGGGSNANPVADTENIGHREYELKPVNDSCGAAVLHDSAQGSKA